MNAAVWLLLYAGVLTWLCPPVLRRISRHGIVPHLGVAVWLTAMTAALLAWAAALVSVGIALSRSMSDGTALSFCLTMLGFSGDVALPGRTAIGATMALTAIAFVASARVVHRSILKYQNLRRDSGEHGRAARIIGTPTARADVVLIPAARPAAYCVGGRPHTIVLTTAAVQVLDRPQLAAVLAHEDAHVRGRHHQLLMVLRAIAAGLPWLPLFTAGAHDVARLLEMCADDAAARHHGRRPLLESLISLAGCPTPIGARLGVADTAVADRVTRLIDVAGGGTRWGHRVQSMAMIAVTATAPVAAIVFCHH